MLCFTAVIPHDTDLLHESAAENQLTRRGIAVVGGELMASKPDVILILSSHAENFSDQYTLFFNTLFSAGAALKKFGVISNAMRPAAVCFLAKLQSFARAHALPLRSVQTTALDVGSAVALRLLKIPDTLPTAVIGSSSARSILDHMETGYSLKDFIQNFPQRVAVIVTGESEHNTDAEPPLATLLARRSVSALIALADPTVPHLVSHPLALCYGLLRGFPLVTRIHADEHNTRSALVTATLFSA